MIFLDTNVLIYAALTQPQDEAKKSAARKLLARTDVGLSVQVLQEFYVQATRKTRPNHLRHEIAAALIESWTRFPVQPMSLDVMMDALRIAERHRLSYWDGAVIAAALALGCCELYTEDMHNGFTVEGLLLINPFL